MKKIFEPIKINQLQLKNRMVVSAMVTNYCNADGTTTEKFIAYHEKKAKGGWGLIITEDYVINPTAGGFVRLPGLWKDEQIESHKKLTERIHKAGGKIAAQIYHAGRETCSAITGEQPIGPTALKDPTMPEIPRELAVDEIHELVEQFGDAAYRARQAGFDAVEVHGAHGYLVGAFMSSFSNKRTDEYGGTIENRARFAVEIIKNIRSKCGADFPILYRISAVEYVHGGLDIEESKVIARILEKAGVDCIHCSQGVYGSVHTVIPPSVFPRAGYVDNAAELKSVVDIPVIAVGRINDPEIAETVIRSGKADLVTMARASLADPDLPNKAAAGKSDDIIRCIGCVQGCIGENGKGNGVRCLVNPMTGMEDEYKFTMTDKSKNVVVVGGGVSGCEAALVAAKRGHKVTLLEKSARLGGQWIPAAIPIGKGEFTSFVHWQNLQLEKYNVNVIYNVDADKKTIESFEPDAVIIATGSKPFIPPIKGIDQESVFTAHEVLLGQAKVGEKVVVIGGGLVGAETADLLAEHGSKVTIVEMLPQIVKDGEPIPTKYLKERFSEYGVDIYVSTAVKSIEGNQVFAEKDGQVFSIDDVDTVVVAVGVKSDKTLLNSLDGSSYEVIAVGDANQVKNGYLGIREGYEAGLNL